MRDAQYLSENVNPRKFFLHTDAVRGCSSRRGSILSKPGQKNRDHEEGGQSRKVASITEKI